MCRSVFAHAYRIMGEDIDDRQLHQSGQPQGRTQVIAKYQERRTVRPQFGQRKPVKDGSHSVFADTEVEVPPLRRVGFEVSRTRKCKPRLGRRRKVSRAAQKPWNALSDGVEHLARGVATGDTLGFEREVRQFTVPSFGQLAPLHQLEFSRQIGISLSVAPQSRFPSSSERAPARANTGSEMLPDALGHEKLRIFGPSIVPLGLSDFLFAERFAVRCTGVLLVRRAIGDMTVDNNQSRTVFAAMGYFKRSSQHL